MDTARVAEGLFDLTPNPVAGHVQPAPAVLILLREPLLADQYHNDGGTLDGGLDALGPSVSGLDGPAVEEDLVGAELAFQLDGEPVGGLKRVRNAVADEDRERDSLCRCSPDGCSFLGDSRAHGAPYRPTP
jgi:hypothetical protein